MEMQPNRVEWKGLTDTQCPVCDWAIWSTIFTKTTLSVLPLEMPIYNLSDVVQVRVGGKLYYAVVQEYLPEWCLQRDCHINSIKTCDQSPGLYEYSTFHNTMATSFPTHKFTYILPGILYHPDVENPVDHEKGGIDPLACPMY